MDNRAAAPIAALVAGMLLTFPQATGAHDLNRPVEGSLARLNVATGPGYHRFLFKVLRDNLALFSHDPREEAVEIIVYGTGPNGGRTPLIELDPANWRKMRGSRDRFAFKYTDKDRSAGGVRSAVMKQGRLGGTFTLYADRADWPQVMQGELDTLGVLVQVDEEKFCAEFGGEVTRNHPSGRFGARNAPRPVSCPDTFCGNGDVELGEECDDGNLVEGDGCNNECRISDCSGTTYDSTWEAIETLVIQGSGCANAVCHGAPVPAGGLDLTQGNAWANLFAQPSTASLLKRVDPGEEDLSFFYNKLAAATLAPSGPFVEGSPMPIGTDPISDDLLAAIRLWIRGGAQETGVVEGTAELFDACLPPPSPNKSPPLGPPTPGEGVQFYSGPSRLAAGTEHELCYGIYYDLNTMPVLVPESAQAPCPSTYGGPSNTCLRYNATDFSQDGQSHHAALYVYNGFYSTSHSSWGGWTCKGGDHDGATCDPMQLGVPASSGGADCGPRSMCTSEFRESPGCVGNFGPPDWSLDFFGSDQIGGAGQPRVTQQQPPGVYSAIPMEGVLIVNTHAFNWTDEDLDMEMYLNVFFADPADQRHLLEGITDISNIFVIDVPAFGAEEYCFTHTVPDGKTIVSVNNHVHRRGRLFRTWGPPQTPCFSALTCRPSTTTVPLVISTEYNDPVGYDYEPPLPLSGPVEDRTWKYCALYDNGGIDPSIVKRRSTSPSPPLFGGLGGPCGTSEVRCIGGPQHNTRCFGDHAACDSFPGAGDGDCDACPLTGGLTTEDEMFVFLASYFDSYGSPSQAFLNAPNTIAD